MFVKKFVLGLPGCGKSKAVDYTGMLARDDKWNIDCINDYDILYEMFKADLAAQRHQFRPTEYGGFDVLDLTVFDMALQKVEQDVTRIEKACSSDENRVIFIEFARNDYREALKQFTASFLQGAFFLFIRADIETCKQRIRERVAHFQNFDDHFVSDYIFETYYNQDIGGSSILELNNTVDPCGVPYAIREENIQVIYNNLETPIIEFDHHLQTFWHAMMRSVTLTERHALVVPQAAR